MSLGFAPLNTSTVMFATRRITSINIDAVSHEATNLDEVTKWVDCRDMKFGGEVNDQLTVGQVLGRITCDDTIHSLFFHGIESPLVCSPIKLFAANDNGIESSFVCCSIKVSADNDKGRFDASSLGGLADVCTVPTLTGASLAGFAVKKPTFVSFRAVSKSS